jgi:hypothetical protein
MIDTIKEITIIVDDEEQSNYIREYLIPRLVEAGSHLEIMSIINGI